MQRYVKSFLEIFIIFLDGKNFELGVKKRRLLLKTEIFLKLMTLPVNSNFQTVKHPIRITGLFHEE